MIHPSKREGLPTVILEAMSTGAIVISSKIDAVNNLIEDEQNGFLFDLNEINDLVQKMLNVLHIDSDERNRIQQQARQTIRTNYEWTVISKRIASLYHRASLN